MISESSFYIVPSVSVFLLSFLFVPVFSYCFCKLGGKSAIIYGHCDCGCDRTGQLFGSYAMRWQNKTWDEANKMNTVIATRPMECENYRNMQWYCLYLKHVRNYAHLTCDVPHPCVKPEVPHPNYFDKGRN